MKEFTDAAFKGDLVQMKALFKNATNKSEFINQKEKTSGKTALSWAIEGCQFAVVEWLIQNGAKVLTDIRLEEGCAKTSLNDTNLIEKKLNEQYKLAPSKDILNKVEICHEMVKIIKKQIQVEAVKIISSIPDSNTTIRLDQSGKLFFGAYKKVVADKKIKDFVKTSVISYPKDLKTLEEKGSKEIMFSYRGEKVKNPTLETERNYCFQPLVFFVDHQDASTFDLISRNFEFFRNMGYSKLCFEFDYDKSFDEVIGGFLNFIEEIENDISQGKEVSEEDKRNLKIAKLHVDFFEKIKHQKWLSYVGVDAALGSLRFSILMESEEFDDLRETEFAKRVVAESDKANGGTITILGLGHSGVQKKLLEHGSTSGFSYQLYGCYSSKNSHIWGNKESIDRKSVKNKVNFNFELTELDVAEGISEVEKILKSKLFSYVDKKAKELGYTRYLSQETSNLSILKELFNLPFSGAMDEEMYVDALLTLENVEQYEKVAQTIYNKMDLAMPMYLRKNEKDQFILTVPHINAENAKCIFDASKQMRSNKIKF